MVVRVGTKNQIHNGEEAKEKWERDREREKETLLSCAKQQEKAKKKQDSSEN
jgi:hypothetical protein